MTDLSLLYIRSEDNALALTARFWSGVPQQSGGGGGFQPVTRPQNSAFTAWQGDPEPFVMTLNVVMDQFTGRGKNVEQACRTLDKMAGILTRPKIHPPLLIIDAAGALQYDYTHYPQGRWVISDTSGAPHVYGTSEGDVLRNEHGQRNRQVVTIPFMHYVAYDEASRADVTTSQSTPLGSFHASAQVDSFRRAAAVYLKSYGGAKLGNRLAQLNGRRDGTAKLAPGSGPYRLPSADQAKSWARTPRR